MGRQGKPHVQMPLLKGYELSEAVIDSSCTYVQHPTPWAQLEAPHPRGAVTQAERNACVIAQGVVLVLTYPL